MNSVTILCPAKLNLTLDITGIEENGYHTMDMLMQAVNLTERVTLTRSRGIRITVAGSRLPVDEKNTAWKAAKVFFEEEGLLAGVDIHIEKATPVRAGMAGGSADAAAVLYGLNLLYGGNLSLERLCELGAKVGADVPFCLTGGTAHVTGFGEKVKPLAPMPFCRFVVVMPGYGISTPEAFAAYDRVGAQKRPDTPAALAALKERDYKKLAGAMANALEKASAGPDTAAICETLTRYGADAALMTGSGAAVFGMFSSDKAALAARAALKKQYKKVWLLQPVCHGPIAE